MSVTAIATLPPINKQPISHGSLPINLIFKLISLLKKSIFSRKFYQEINDKVLSKSSTVDYNLYFICYFSLLVSSVLNNKSHILFFLRKQIFKLKQLYYEGAKQFGFNQESNEKLSQLKPPVYQELKPSQLAYNLKKINSYLADVRIFNRLTDSIKYMPWVIDEFYSWRNPSSKISSFNRFINFIQALNVLVLELFENAGWLTDHDFVSTGDNPWWSFETYIWCCRIWAAYVGIEVIELIRRTPYSKMDKNWKIALFKNLVQIPLTIHWSLRDGCLSPFWVGVCGSCASWWNFKDMWSSIDLN
ncbi:unnamed protein product [Candida verbasci]|uniref:Uncharacterized protein n=1 Tax=Candida verbasci TaxID=1227364 RepID=A0A9W4TZT3_9ASCO|nr:unnamed protein product [Candida verbasci]